jgi:hypothetical protein
MSTPGNEYYAPPPPPPATRKKKWKWPWIVAVVALLLIIVGGCGESDQGKNNPTSGMATAQGPQRPADVQGLTFDVKPGPDGDIVTANFKIGENLTNGLTKDGARIDTMKILKYVHAAYPNLAEVHVNGSADMVDKYGNSKDEQVVTLTYTRATLNKINWDGVDFHDMWNIADSAEVHPAFQY